MKIPYITAILLLFLVGGIMSDQSKNISITIVYDNNSFIKELQSDWGFSCFIKGIEKTILFDTGTDGNILLSNMEKLGIGPKEIEIVLLSHIHGDHTGGLWEFLKRNSNVTVYVPNSFPEDFKKKIKSYGAEYIDVSKNIEVCKNVYSTGELGTSIKEQSLVIETEKGLIVITGCAHPGIVEIVRSSMESSGKEVYLVFGGFHLISHSKREIKEIIKEFREISIIKAGPCHCSGETAREMFKEEYGEDFVEIGVGKVIEIK
jgi:7,8-dihydropterin-6-yl-methyl-4-(beta-D-ribofuranosyl)aminobenzene 5'-phosphate synthase